MNYFNRFKNKFSTVDPFPLIIYDDFLTDDENDEIYKVIRENDVFDTEKFGGRKQVRMGSQNYQNIIEKNTQLKNISDFLNSEKTFKFLLEEINSLPPNDKNYLIIDKKMSYDKKPSNSFFNQNLKFSDKILNKIKKIFNYDNKKVSLQIDFSLSKKGYSREPHTDKPTRILVMLIYFNNLEKKDGGSLDIYKYKSPKKTYNTNPSFDEIEMKYSFVPKAKSLIIFQSNPVSVRAVSEMISNKERVFAYGAYSMKYPVNWYIEE